MTIDAYINPDFTFANKVSFFLIALAGVLVSVFFILGGVKLSVFRVPKDERRVELYERSHNRVQRFYEMIISATSVMSFSCAYIIINHIYSNLHLEKYAAEYAQYKWFVDMWDNGKDFILLLLICLSCLINTILDRILIPLKRINKDEKASVRMLGMFYVIFILLYLNTIGDESEYSPVMLYYLGLMIGRFVYFDASFMDFLIAIKNAAMNLPLLIIGLSVSGYMCFYGFDKGYLLERNYYLVGAFYTHLFLLLAVFIVKHSHLVDLLVRKPKGYDEDYDPMDEYEYEDEGYGNEEEYYNEDDYSDEYDPDLEYYED